ncbi:MAG: hypothetical protein DHS20C08_04520 [Rhodomicrobium sp.]|nr:MAG: hypothetical protein DHS20C08_04520 [Rhodomicrobium sp.]
MWTLDNTEGFTQSELDMINAVVSRTQSENPDVDESNINDRANNAWFEGISEAELYNSVKF